MKRVVVLLVAVLGVSVWMGVLIFEQMSEVKAARAEQAKPVQVAAPAVRTAQAAAHDYREVVTVGAEILPERTVNVLPKLGGVVETVHVELGQTVTDGDPLVTLEEGSYGWQTKTAQAQAAAARAGLNQAKVAVAAAQVEVNRARKLHARGALPKADLDRAEAGLAQAQAAAKSGSAQVRVANTAAAMAADVLTWREVKSPLTGVVTRVDVQQGAMAGPSAPLVEVQDQSRLKLSIKLPARARARAKKGDKVTFTVDARPGETFTATLDLLGPSLDPRSRKAMVEATVDPDQAGLLPHMRADVTVLLRSQLGVVSAPRQAILTTPLGSVVFVVRDGKAVAVGVEPGRSDATHVPLGDTVAAGETIVVAGQSLVEADGPVRIISQASEASDKAPEAAEEAPASGEEATGATR